MWDNATNQPSKSTAKSWVEIHGDACGTYNTNGQIKAKTKMLKSSLCS